MCESTKGWLTEIDGDGTPRRHARIKRFTRGLAFVGPYALVGGNAHREEEDDRGEIAVVDLRDLAVVERIPMPCLEVYDIMAVGAGVVRGVRAGFGANASRAVEQHRALARPDDRRPAPDAAALHLVTPFAAGVLAAAGQRLDGEQARRCGLRGTLPATATSGEVATWTVELVNRSDRVLATVPPRPVKVGARWFRLPDDGNGGGDADGVPAGDAEGAGAGHDEPVVNPMVPIPRVVPPAMRTSVQVPIEVPAEPGRYRVRIALRQPGLGWFGVRVEREVRVDQPRGSATRPTNSGAPEPTWRTANR